MPSPSRALRGESTAGVPGRHVEERNDEAARRRQAACVAAGPRDCFTAPQVTTAPAQIPPPIDPHRWYYRRAYLPWARALSAYHRMRLEGPPPPRGPCIYVALHGAGYLVVDRDRTDRSFDLEQLYRDERFSLYRLPGAP